MAKLATVPLMYQPGTTWEYRRSTDVLGHLIERASGQPLDAYLQARILGPLGMKDTGFFAEPEQQSRIAEAFATDPDSKADIKLSTCGKSRNILPAAGIGFDRCAITCASRRCC